MSKHKQGGKLTQSTRPRPKYLGIKVTDGQKVTEGMVLVRQRGTKVTAGAGVEVGRDFTLYSIKSGILKFKTKLGRKYIEVV